MFKKYKNIIFLLIIFALLGAQTAYALEAKYPAIIGLPRITDESKMPDLIRYFFGLGMYVSAILALISFTVGAIQTIMSAASPEAEKEGKDRMKSSVLGLTLTLAAFLIMKTINFSLVQPSISPLPGVAGIYYTNGTDLKPAQTADNTSNVPAGYEKIKYKCPPPGSGETGPKLLVWRFPKPNFSDEPNYPNTNVVRSPCFGEIPLPLAGSFKWTFETPGIYYFLKDGCKGLMSGANLTTGEISEPFKGKIKSVRIVNDAATDNYLGVIFHSDPDPEKGSDCTRTILADKDDECINLSDYFPPPSNFTAYSADIFVYRKNDLSGDGVCFYSNVNGWDAGVRSGKACSNAEEIGDALVKEAEYFTFDYTGVDSPTASICRDFPSCRDKDITDEQMADPSFMCCLCDSPKDWSSKDKDCGGSIRFGGNSYLVTLYTDYKDKDKKQRLFCQSFKKDAPNLSTESFLPSASAELSNINIIPIK